MTQEVVREVPGAKFTIMTKLGHFPMSENYNHFREYLLPILEEIRRNSEKPVSAAPAPAR
jgi:pimeloyl-ACP methyl ester carboxylesterase